MGAGDRDDRRGWIDPSPGDQSSEEVQKRYPSGVAKVGPRPGTQRATQGREGQVPAKGAHPRTVVEVATVKYPPSWASRRPHPVLFADVQQRSRSRLPSSSIQRLALALSQLPAHAGCWQPTKMGQSETREIRGLIEV